jgi:hypothetical protein
VSCISWRALRAGTVTRSGDEKIVAFLGPA